MEPTRLRPRRTLLGVAALALGATVACKGGNPEKKAPGASDAKAGDAKKDQGPDPAAAKAFVAEADKKLRELWVAQSKAEWEKSTNITDENEAKAAKANEAVMAYTSEAIKKASSFKGVKADPETRRQLSLISLSTNLPAPNDDKKRAELAEIVAKLEGMYGKGEVCEGEGDKKTCQDLGGLSAVMAKADDYDAQLKAWEGWRTVSVPMRPMFARLVELGNEGAKDIGFKDVGELWRSKYDMDAPAFEKELNRLWAQMEPLYKALHCHVRAKLAEKYGDKVPADGPIPAHLLGNMWAQDWANLYPMLEPYAGEPSLDVTAALEKKGYDPIKMVKLGEGFFDSMGLGKLPPSFWERSLFTQPEDRKVVCHPSAWDVDYNNDLRLKMCIKVDHEDLVTIHHELGHHYYFTNYYKLPIIYQDAAHDGFHEAIGDAIALSMTPGYLKEVGLLDTVSMSEKSVINKQMQDALTKIAFLPFGKLVDQWRWDVFSGKIKPDQMNAGWWKLRTKMQGVAAPSERSEEQFDPGAKYHVAGNVPYTRYFLAYVLQFQFHRAMCTAAGHEGPAHACSFYGSKEAGAKLKKMLELGRSKPWPDALEALTGKREMDATALVLYFDPLIKWLEEQNKGRTCGW